MFSYIFFIMPHLYFGNVINNQSSNTNVSSKIESVWYAALATIGTLEIEHQHNRSLLKRFCLFKNVLSNKVPEYIRHYFRHFEPILLFFLPGRSTSWIPFFLKSWKLIIILLHCKRKYTITTKQKNSTNIVQSTKDWQRLGNSNWLF